MSDLADTFDDAERSLDHAFDDCGRLQATLLDSGEHTKLAYARLAAGCVTKAISLIRQGRHAA